MSFAGKTLKCAIAIRGTDDPEVQMDGFIEIYDEFIALFGGLDGDQ